MAPKIIDTPICEVEDEEFQTRMNEFCLGIGLELAGVQHYRFTQLVNYLVRENIKFARNHFPPESVLGRRIQKIAPGTALHTFCGELAAMKRQHIESFDGKTVLTLIKDCYKSAIPPLKPKKRKAPPQPKW